MLGLDLNIAEASCLLFSLLVSQDLPYDKSIDWIQFAYTGDRFRAYVVPGATELKFRTRMEGGGQYSVQHCSGCRPYILGPIPGSIPLWLSPLGLNASWIKQGQRYNCSPLVGTHTLYNLTSAGHQMLVPRREGTHIYLPSSKITTLVGRKSAGRIQSMGHLPNANDPPSPEVGGLLRFEKNLF